MTQAEGQWFKSSFSSANGCVEVKFGASEVQVRDSKNCDGPRLTFTPIEWAAFLRGVGNAEFELPQQ
jgi:hypothetical protein